MKTKKGYISFILFFLISIILLSPLFFYHSNYPSWPSFLLKKTFTVHILQKRAIEGITIDTYEQLKPTIVLLKNAKNIKDGLSSAIAVLSVFFPPAATLIPLIETLGESLVRIASSYQTREAFVKLTIFLAWSDLSSKWEQNSDYSLSVDCSNPFSSLPISFPKELFETLELDKITSSLPFFLDCYNVIEYQESSDPLKAGKLVIHPSVNILTSSKLLKNATASSNLRPFKVE